MVVWKTILTRILSTTYSINTMFLSTCYSDGGVGGYGMSWFDAMECCYYNKVAFLSHLKLIIVQSLYMTNAFFKGYLAEPQSADEQAKIEEYIQVLGQRFKHKLDHLEQKSIKKLHCRLEEESQHKRHLFE